MPLNVKLALLMSVGVIAGFFYALQGIDSRTLHLPSPLASTAAAAPGNTRVRLGTSDPASRRLTTPSPVAERPLAARGASPSHVGTDPGVAPSPAPLLPPRSPDATTAPDVAMELEIADRPLLLTAVRPPVDPTPEPVTTSAESKPHSTPAGSGASADSVVKPEATQRYTVKSGDTLVRIARRELQSDSPEAVQRLLEANPALKARPDRLLVGAVLVIPTAGGTTPMVSNAKPRSPGAEPLRTADSVASGDSRSRPPAGRDATVAEPHAARTYKVQPNDSLRSIAAKILKDGSRWPELAKLNAISNGDRIQAGTVLRLPPERVASR
ncbi:MAG: LysM peptidoglycan-binding domain-containing protein [Phycisphaerales bacterium]|nr:LysM peptidoglycan-binding domain-containing protein [Phycisphaerales bacterium]